VDPACSGENSRDEHLLDTTAGVCLTKFLVLGFGCILQQRLALGPQLSIGATLILLQLPLISYTMVTSITRLACPARWRR